MRPALGEVLHFSEEPAIEVFHPPTAPTSTRSSRCVRAVDYERCPDYWSPRQCPRAMSWVKSGTTDADRDRILGPGGGTRVHAVEHDWRDATRTVELCAYRLPADVFSGIRLRNARPHPDDLADCRVVRRRPGSVTPSWLQPGGRAATAQTSWNPAGKTRTPAARRARATPPFGSRAQPVKTTALR
ncbi:MAG TPA: hypothetical protein VGJ44_07790 [Kribbellaceae bacterium]